jgi:hypothetical protein
MPSKVSYRSNKRSTTSGVEPIMDSEADRHDHTHGMCNMLLCMGLRRRLCSLASQNIAAAAMIPCSIREPNDPYSRQIHQNLRGLVECASVQQMENSLSR